MTCLSVAKENGPATVVANPIFVLSDGVNYPSAGEIYRFEVMQADSARLTILVGEYRLFMFDDKPIWGRLISLQPAASTHPGLALLSNSSTLLGVIETIAEDSTRLSI